MATRNTRSTTDPANSEAESSSFTEAILSHPILLTSLKAQEILHLQHVCTAWRKWYSGEGIITTIATARQQDDNKDWYFPLFVNKTNSSQPERNSSWTWSAIWHECAHHASENMQSLPPLRHLPFEWTFSKDRRSNDIVAGDGGLLLFKTLRGVVPVRRSSRLNAQPSNYDLLRLPQDPISKSLEPLLVCNPFTKEFRVLPEAYCLADNARRMSTDPERLFHGVQVNMVVDESANSYRVILTFRAFVCIYCSTSNRWESFRFEERGPWGRSCPIHDAPWAPHVCGNVYSRGSLFFADIELARTFNPRRMTFRLRLFQINLEVAPGTWKLQRLNIPPRSFRGNFEHCVLRDILYGIVGHAPRIFPDLELVECMGELYAVVPARLDRSLEMGAEELQRTRPDYYESVRHLFNAELEFMPLKFFIFQLQGGNLIIHGALRIELPRSTRDIRSRRESLHWIQLQKDDPYRHLLSCTASKSVIWVSCEDYLLQYDVVTGESKTEIIPVNEKDHKLKFSYRPSFHMKP